ncbi:MAG: MBOAT family protein [Bacteroidales bacterium]|nr:MBOAT family protein [Bacteroidales bacterium]
MVFSSSIFLFYFLPVFLAVYLLVGRRLKNAVALFFSLLFYGFGSPRFLLILLLSILIDYFLVREVGKWRTENGTPKGSPTDWEVKRKMFLVLSIILNIGLLAYFKYANFFIDNLSALFGWLGLSQLSTFNSQLPRILLPIGISFFTFQKMSYSIDVYRGTAKPLNNIADYALYIMLFPQLIAGPIVRYNEIADQITDRSANETTDNRILGFYRFVLGLSKKMLIANILAEYADQVFALPAQQIGTSTAWLGILAYTFQIYFDFAGYSDMAIGIGRMIGFKFPENFNNPYISRSVTEFWKRWHITLGRWMMDYLYIPLGGNRKGVRRTYLNLWIVFFLSGLWHGAAWTFVAWGAYHGLFICLDKLLNGKRRTENGKFSTFRFPFSVPLTFVIVMIGWVLFRSDTIGYAVHYVGAMFGANGSTPALFVNSQFVFTLIVAAIFSFIGLVPSATLRSKLDNLSTLNFKLSTPRCLLLGLLMLLLLLLSASFILKGSFNPFIYFRF